MTRAEWIEVVQRMRLNWPHSRIDDAVIAKWYEDTKHLPAEQVTVAVEVYYREGREFPPNGALILAKIAELDRDELDYGEAWRLAKRASLKADPVEGFAWLERRSSAAAEAVRQLCGGHLSYDLGDEAIVRAQFRDVYRNVCAARRRDDAYAGLPNAGLRGLERGPRKLGSALARALPQGPAEGAA